MKTLTTLITLACAALPCACVIDGVPLPDERGDPDANNNVGDPAPASAITEGIYATSTRLA